MGKTNESNSSNLGFEEKLWKATDKLRNNVDAAEYKHIVLGLIFQSASLMLSACCMTCLSKSFKSQSLMAYSRAFDEKMRKDIVSIGTPEF